MSLYTVSVKYADKIYKNTLDSDFIKLHAYTFEDLLFELNNKKSMGEITNYCNETIFEEEGCYEYKYKISEEVVCEKERFVTINVEDNEICGQGKLFDGDNGVVTSRSYSVMDGELYYSVYFKKYDYLHICTEKEITPYKKNYI